MTRWVMAALLAAGLLAVGVWGQEPGEARGKRLRAIVPVRYSDAKALAQMLSKHFQGDGDVHILADPSGGHLLVNAPEKQMGELGKLIGQMDRRPRAIALEVLIAEVAPRKNENDPKLQESDLSGPAPDVLKAVEGLRKKGVLSAVRRLQIAAVENQPASAAVGESVPFMTPVANPIPRLPRTGVIMYRDLGAVVKVKARVAADKAVHLDLQVQDSRRGDDQVVGKDENGADVRAARFSSAVYQGQLTVTAGQVVLAKGVEVGPAAGKRQILILVTARVLDPAPKGGG